MKTILTLFKKTLVICVVFIVCHSALFAQGKAISSFLGATRKSFINSCLLEKWEYTTNIKGSMNFDFPGGNWYVSFNDTNVIDLINLTTFGKEKGDLMMQKLTTDASRVDDNATVTRWRRGTAYLMYFKMFQPDNGSSILISDDFFSISSDVAWAN